MLVLFTASIFAQLLYISPAMDLALSVYEPFFISQPARPGEIGLFRVMNASAVIQIISFEVAPAVTLDQLAVSTKQAAMNERSSGMIKIANLDCFFRWFSIETSGRIVQSFQLIFLRLGRAYVSSYFAPEEEFYTYLVPALLTVQSLKGATWFNHVDERHGYKLMVYEPFKPAEVEEGEIGSFIALDEGKVGYIQIVQEKLPRPMKVNEYADLVERNTLSKLNQYKLFSSRQNLVEGNEFFWRIFSFAQNQMNLKALQAHLVTDQVAITLTYLSSEENFEQFLPAAVGTIFSFKM
ncbi:MAG: hypothetical protein H5T94_03960 [Pseudothermotoga sp.]|nr:hypothetical protein [Pseudothermotoga sp.]